MALTRVRNGMRFISFFTLQRGGKRSGMLQTESIFPITSEMRDSTFEASPVFEKSSPNLVAQTHAKLASGISNHALQAGIRHFSSRNRLTVDLCSNCKQPGHLARECTNGKACHNCGQLGHLAAMCTEEPLCYRCLKRGHTAAYCPRNTYSDKICYNCKQKGHYASVCPSPAACNNCHLPGHLARDCTASKACHKCGKDGHLARHCPEGVVAEENPTPLTCPTGEEET